MTTLAMHRFPFVIVPSCASTPTYDGFDCEWIYSILQRRLLPLSMSHHRLGIELLAFFIGVSDKRVGGKDAVSVRSMPRSANY